MTDFYARYDATSDRMRYDEIEQRFREKLAPFGSLGYQTAKAVIDSTVGRIEVSEGSKGFLFDTIQQVVEFDKPVFALVAASEGMTGSVTEADAKLAFGEPLYFRHGGWLVAQPKIPVTTQDNAWVQRLFFAETKITPSGDLVFLKVFDESLCRNDDSFYPNAIVEYSLSFAYLLADIVAASRPSRMLVAATVAGHGRTPKLALGEGGSIWYEANMSSAKAIQKDPSKGVAIVTQVDTNKAVRARKLAFQIASQVYGFFGYNQKTVPFAAKGEITFESDDDMAVLTSIRTYLRDTLRCPVFGPREDYASGSAMFRVQLDDGRRSLWIDEAFVADHRWPEGDLLNLLEQAKISDTIRSTTPKTRLLLSNEGLSNEGTIA